MKALSCISSNPESVFSVLCDSEVRSCLKPDRSSLYSTEMQSIRVAFQKASTSSQRKIIFSLIALQYTYKNLCQASGLKISRRMCHEARLYAKAFGPGADAPKMNRKTIVFSEAQLKEVSEFVLRSDNTSNRAWGV